MSGERCHELYTEELEYPYDLSNSTSEYGILYFSRITSYSFELVWKLRMSPSLSSSSDPSVDEENQEQSSRFRNASFCRYGKLYAMEIEGACLCCQDTTEIPKKFFRGTHISNAF